MEVLHPLLTLGVVLLIIYSFLEVYSNEYVNFKSMWFVVAFLIILAGYRYWVGADYGAYNQTYKYSGFFGNYGDIFKKAFFRESRLEMEWLWILIGKLFFDFGQPFHHFVLLIAVISIATKYAAFQQAVVYPALSMALYMFPSFFSGDMGQMRQAIAMGFLLFSFLYIKKRNLPMFLLMIYIAMGFHKSSAVFLPAYWLATVPLTPRKMIVILLACILVSPLQIYNYITIFAAIAPNDVYSGFSDYAMIESESAGGITFTDLLSLLYMFFMITFNREACAKIPYYEYMRNIGFAGICIFYIFRWSPIFSGRLSAIYLVYMVMVIPNVIASVENLNYRKYLHLVVVLFIGFYYFVYSYNFGKRAGFTPERYKNHLFMR